MFSSVFFVIKHTGVLSRRRKKYELKTKPWIGGGRRSRDKRLGKFRSSLSWNRVDRRR